MTAEDWDRAFSRTVTRSEVVATDMTTVATKASRLAGDPDRVDFSYAAIRDAAVAVGGQAIAGDQTALERGGVSYSRDRHAPQAIEFAVLRAAGAAMALVVADHLTEPEVALLTSDLTRDLGSTAGTTGPEPS